MVFRESQSDVDDGVGASAHQRMCISSMRISDEPIWTAMARLVPMKPSLSSRAPVSPNRPLRRPEAEWFPWSCRFYTTVSEEKQQANQQTPRVPELEKHHVNQPSTEEVNSLNSCSNKQPKLIKRLIT
ncbi:uncharacterized protein LOC126621340 isoform X2 [Malus sylvestris]|uniref:uncharacterized protein n=1 Tax=Malus domestica TaxID=3750 RepID=UPI0021AC0A5B|nr:uncharacterized protein LOC126621340 isoform X2 [Malus sylvestris]